MDAAATLRSRLAGAFAMHVAARALEAASVGFAAGTIVVAAGTWTAPSTPGGALAAAACVAGSAAAGAWFLERRPRRARHAGSVDRRLELDGALVTATAPATGGGVVAEALRRRVVARASLARLARASLPATPLALVALLGGAAVLVAVRETAERPVARTLPSLDGVRSAAARAAADARRALATGAVAGADARAAWSTFAREADAFARSTSPTASEAAVPSTERLRTVADALARAADATRGSERSPDADAAFARARASLAELSGRLREPASTAFAGAGQGSSGGDSSGGGGAEGSTPDRPLGAGAQAPTLTQAPADGRMVPPRIDGTDPVAAPAPAGTPGVERGTAALRWWSPEHDAVVERWVASRGPR